MQRPTKARRNGDLLAEILSAPDRDRSSGARPVVSVRELEDPSFLAEVEARRRGAADLSRRGLWHGEWAELDPPGLSASLADLAARWHAARPIVIHGAACEAIEDHQDDLAAAESLHAALQEPRGLRRWLAARVADLEPGFSPLSARPRLFDPARDLERVLFESTASPARPGRGRKVDDLWIKSSWLSTFEGDDSLRVRVSFGREREDDASGDLLRHRLVADLATRLFPESALVSANPELGHLLERLVAAPVLFTQHIAYWNAPEGGALFHHDAFADDEEETGRPGQLGVAYVQLTGRTAWIALSIGDLSLRVREFVECLEEGALPWVRAQLFPEAASWKRLLSILEDEDALADELARPACGALGGLVNRGPEFTSFLADAGHGSILAPGDAILLPNHGLTRTAMHSVFCASEEVAYGLSLAIRADREEPLVRFEEPERTRRGSRRARKR